MKKAFLFSRPFWGRETVVKIKGFSISLLHLVHPTQVCGKKDEEQLRTTETITISQNIRLITSFDQDSAIFAKPYARSICVSVNGEKNLSIRVYRSFDIRSIVPSLHDGIDFGVNLHQFLYIEPKHL